MWLALALTGLGWASTTALLLWQLGRIKASLIASEAKVSSLAVEVLSLREHIDTQATILKAWQDSWADHRARLEGSIDALRSSNQFAWQALRETLSHGEVPAHLAGALAASVLSTGPSTSTTAPAPRPSAEPGALPPVTRPPPRGGSGGG